MSFVSLTFLVFLAAVFGLYWARPTKGWQNCVVLGASYTFYGWWDWRFCFLMLASSLVDYFAGVAIYGTSNATRRKAYLVAALSCNLAVLGIFKYFDFFADSLAISLALAGIEISTPTFHILLPVGISFYTFQTMSYTIDIYRGHFEPQRSVIDYLSFVSFFPQLVAGPIERATNLLPQFRSARSFSFDEAQTGMRLVLWGFLKKMLIADNLAAFVDTSFAAPQLTSGAALLLATIFFSFQIYCDFSAYSDIAAGVAALFGIRLMRNFAYPYLSQTVTEFWRRWHISLSTWFRDYVYFPLGGNRVSPARCYRNLLVICVVSGLWHGASWTFVAWGFLHGVYLVIERRLGWNKMAPRPESAPAAISGLPSVEVLFRILCTYALVSITWVFFRASSLEESLLILKRIFTAFGSFGEAGSILAAQTWLLGLIAAFVLVEWVGRFHWNPLKFERLPVFFRWAAYTAAVWAILLFGTRQSEEFIYFRF